MATGTPALIVLAQAKVPHSLHEYTHDPRVRGFGEESAAALGLEPDQVLKTLIAVVDGDPTVAMVPVSGQLDLKSLAMAAGGRRADLAPTALAERTTGYVLGGISPIGQKRVLPMYLEEQAILFEVVYVSGGRRGLSVGLAPDDLLAITGARLAPIARFGHP
jgi:Cys-tRNA(Pro)/Cys-tRNA(Cys) deacylase